MAPTPIDQHRRNPGDSVGDVAPEGLAEVRRQLAAALLDAERLRAAAGHHRRIVKELDQELRTPLTPILVELAVLEQAYDGPLPERQKRAMAILRRNVQRWVTVAQRLLAELQEDAGAESARRVDL